MSAESSPKIVIVDESPIRAAILQEGLQEAGFTGVIHISEMQSLLPADPMRSIRRHPDRSENPAVTFWNKCSRSAAPCSANRHVRQPSATRRRFKRGGCRRVNLYRRQLEEERIKPILDLCICGSSTRSQNCKMNPVRPSTRWKSAR